VLPCLEECGFSSVSFHRPPLPLLYLNVVFLLPNAWRCILPYFGLATLYTCLIPLSQPKSLIYLIPLNCLLPLLGATPCIHTGFWLVKIYSLTHYDFVTFLLARPTFSAVFLARPTFSVVFIHGCSLMAVERLLVLGHFQVSKIHRGLIPLS